MKWWGLAPFFSFTISIGVTLPLLPLALAKRKLHVHCLALRRPHHSLLCPSPDPHFRPVHPSPPPLRPQPIFSQHSKKNSHPDQREKEREIGEMRRQDSQLSSTSRREMAPGNHHATSIGCMSGIFQLLCTYHIRRKFLTLGKKTAVSCPKEEALLSKTQSATESNNKKHGDIVTDVRRLSCEVPRSPTIPADIRRWNSINSPDNCGTPPALVARLMGLEGVPAPETAAEKRRKLLGALEKCDEDLKALKKIIEALRSAENLRPSPVVKNVIVEDSGELTKKKRVPEFNGEQPSPVSVLDEFTRSPPSTYAQKYTNGRRGMRQQKQQLVRKKPGEDNDIKLSAETAKQVEKINADESSTAQQLPWYWSSSGGMIETVEEVRRDIAWGEKREVGRIGLALQDHICRDLIEETVKEMGCCCIIPNSLPLEACKRRLCF